MAKPKRNRTIQAEPSTAPPAVDDLLEILVPPNAINDRMLPTLRPHCPECDAFPVVCTHKRPGYSAYRCRECGYSWEEGAR